LLHVQKINVFYGDLQVIWDATLHVSEGELVTIIGANAAGKSTILKTISGQIHPVSGSITFMGRRIDNLHPYDIVKLGISQVPEGRRIFPDMTVLENLKLGAYILKDRRKVMDNLEWVFSLFPILRERRNQVAKTLSGGEQQILAMARALMLKPKLYLIDEPSLGLAPTMVNKIFEIIKQLKEEGITILLVEQNVAQALKLADRGYVIEGGRIVLEGSSKELLQNKHVREAFLGIGKA